jgi:hypothetical protein
MNGSIVVASIQPASPPATDKTSQATKECKGLEEDGDSKEANRGELDVVVVERSLITKME